MEIDRSQLRDAVRSFARGGGVVVGAPGVGKSHLLRGLVEETLAAGVPCLFIRLDHVPIESDAQLRDEVGFTGDVISYLRSQAQSSTEALLVIDALDAVRSDRGRAFIMTLAERVKSELSPRWSVVMSVRTYDARQSHELERLFPGDVALASEFRLPGIRCRHLFVPPLTDDQIRSDVRGVPGIAALHDAADEEFRALLGIPFNLWLLERIGVLETADDLDVSAIRSEIQLLGEFWRQRVEAGPHAVDKRVLLTRVVREMVERQALSVRTDEVFEFAANATWEQLHSTEILAAPDSAPNHTAFSHNILFDYAVSVLLLDDSPTSLEHFLADDPGRSFFLRPSLNYYMLRLWYSDRPRFWSLFWRLHLAETPQVRLFTKVIAPGTVAREARRVEELAPLLEPPAEFVVHRDVAIQRVLQAHRTHQVVHDELWSEFAQVTASTPALRYANELSWLVRQLAGRTPTEATARRVRIAAAARDLFEWAYESENEGLWRLASAWLVPVIAATYSTDRDRSRALLMRIVDRVSDPAQPVDFVYRLADASNDIWPVDGDLVRRLYEAVFSHVETNEDRTMMLPGVVALTSTRRQDFGMAQYVLTQHLPSFLREAPESAIPAALRATNSTALVREVRPYSAQDESLTTGVREFTFRNRTARMYPDRSHFWDAGGSYQHDAHEIFDSVAEYVQSVIEGQEDSALERFLDLFAEHAVVGFAWRRLLVLGSQSPGVLGTRLLELLLTPVILSSRETVREAGVLIEVVAPLLDQDQRLAIESAVVNLADGDEAQEELRWAALRLIARFTPESLQTERGQSLYAEASSEREAIANPPLVEIGEIGTRAFTQEDWLTREGIDVSSNESREVLRFGEPLEEFSRKHQNAVPSSDEIRDVIPRLSEALAFVEEAALEPLLEDAAWAAIGNASRIVVRAASNLAESDFELSRCALLECARGAAPRVRDDAGSFDFPAWSSAARNEAAAGLPWLHSVRPDAETRQAMLELATDPMPSVRYLLASDLWRIEESDAETFWELAARYIEHESNHVVLDGVVGSLARAASIDNEPLVVDLLARLLERGLERVGREHRPEDQLSSLVVGLAVGRGNLWALNVVGRAIADAPADPEPLKRYLWSLLQFVSAWRADVETLRESFERGVGLVEAAVRAAFTGLEQTVAEGDPDDPDAQQRATALVEILDQVVARLYFQSGVYESQNRPRLSQDEICLFYSSIRPVLALLAERAGGSDGTGLPARTSHYLVELLRGAISCDPPGVVHMARLVVEAGLGAGYAFDPLAEREVVALIETLLADHREEVREGAALEDLMSLLDSFVDVGSPEAQKLVWRLEELFR